MRIRVVLSSCLMLDKEFRGMTTMVDLLVAIRASADEFRVVSVQLGPERWEIPVSIKLLRKFKYRDSPEVNHGTMALPRSERKDGSISQS